jgi:hypothetical protein
MNSDWVDRGVVCFETRLHLLPSPGLMKTEGVKANCYGYSLPLESSRHYLHFFGTFFVDHFSQS